jgi:putative endonuclease
MKVASKLQTSYFGNLGEIFAQKLLETKGYKILKRKFRSTFGEIDLICLKDDTLVFVEVKTRWSKKFGSPEESVTPHKLSKIKKTAQYFSLLNPSLPKKQLIEVMAIEVDEGKVSSVKVIKVD